MRLAADETAQRLREMVARGSYGAGDRLPPERALATAMGVSRPSLREAIRQLVAGGLLEARHGSGTFVAAINLGDLFEVRLQLEPLAAELAASRRSDEELDQLTKLGRMLADALDVPESFAKVDLEVHLCIADASGNQYLRDSIVRLTELTQLSRATTSPDRSIRSTALTHVQSAISAIVDRKAAEAGTEMRDHIASIRDLARLPAADR